MASSAKRILLRSNAWVAAIDGSEMTVRPWAPPIFVVLVPVAIMLIALVALAFHKLIPWQFCVLGIVVLVTTGVAFAVYLHKSSRRKPYLVLDTTEQVARFPHHQLECGFDCISQWIALRKDSPTGVAVEVVARIINEPGETADYVVLTDVFYSAPIKLVDALGRISHRPVVKP